MESIEKNDVDITKLFNWGKEISILDEDDNPIINAYIRIIGDMDVNKARVFALRKSAELRRKLHDESSDEYYMYIPDFSITEKDVLVEFAISSMVREITTRVLRELDLTLPQEPDELAPLSEHEEYQKKIDEWPKTRQEKIAKAVEKELEKERERLNKLSDGEIQKIYKQHIIDDVCEEEMYKQFSDIQTYFSIYKDENYKERLFKSFEEYANLPTYIKNQFIDAYGTLSIRIDELKK